MAEVLDEFPSEYKRKTGMTPLDWHLWDDGRVWKLRKGEDFLCKTTSLRQMAYRYAAQNGLYAKVHLPEGESGEGDTVIIQFVSHREGVNRHEGS